MDELTLNGINGATGEYLFPPATMEQLSRAILGDSLELEQHESLHRRLLTHKGVDSPDPNDLARVGWAIVFAQDDPDAERKREALSDLIALRQRECGDLLRVLIGEDGYRSGESKRKFLERVGADVSGPARPEKFPYYVLLVGPPTLMPFRFQYLLDIQYAVGRLDFEEIDDFRGYAASVVESTEGEARRTTSLEFFGTSNDDDVATMRSLNELMRPLAERFDASGMADGRRFGPEATKAAFRDMLMGPSRPAVLFTATHGVGFVAGHPDQRSDQGALLCQDWPGPKSREGHLRSHYVSGADIDEWGEDVDIHGMVAFQFACYGAGTPKDDDFVNVDWKHSLAGPAPEPFLSRLPQRLLTCPGGGALAAIGHVERQWTYSFAWPGDSPGSRRQISQIGYLETTLRKLAEGHRVGAAMEVINQRYAEVGTEWAEEEEEVRASKAAGTDLDRQALNALWMAKNDARNYIVVGDPAVRASVPLR